MEVRAVSYNGRACDETEFSQWKVRFTPSDMAQSTVLLGVFVWVVKGRLADRSA
jgi:hypothetical protein